ncbi:hypothetical protein ZIOFF_058553 [Zingiber officinale]|uniref:[RNA-polymerase]-subunit kinase n=1 Tax=Zingiber officinale TaxID=94328 RepID=A0A8J5FGB1_ZINOF|nr:hypothetical protein ZIOFF_058553 [Zingiber officinale]
MKLWLQSLLQHLMEAMEVLNCYPSNMRIRTPAPLAPWRKKKKIYFTVAQSFSHVGEHKRRVTADVGAHKKGPNARGSHDMADGLGIGSVPNGLAGEQVAAGWPSWLADVAGEAINGWLPRRGESFEKLDKIGEGTYSHVFRARDLETNKVVAIKKVRFANMDPESVRFMIKCYVNQLLEGLDHCHSRGILHRDIKSSNLLVNNNGILRIADFGLATLFTGDQGQQLTSRVVTLWYRPPELLLGATEYGAAVDLWSSGCILAELFAGRPIMPGRTEVEQLHKIFKLCGSPSEEYWEKSKLPHATIFKPQHQYRRCFADTFKDFPPSTLSLLGFLLAIEPEKRGTAATSLQSEFFSTMPIACDPSSLPKYPPSKEYDAKLQDEARRQRAAERSSESVRTHNWVSRATPAPEVQNPLGNANPKSISEKYNKQDGEGSGFLMELPGGPLHNVFSHSGMHPNAFDSTWTKRSQEPLSHASSRTYSSMRVSNDPQLRTQMLCRPNQSGADFSDISDSFAARGNAGSKGNRLDGGEPAEHKKDDIVIAKEQAQVYGNRIPRIHYSGPLMPSGGNVEDMLKEHERHIQQAVRKSRKNF